MGDYLARSNLLESSEFMRGKIRIYKVLDVVRDGTQVLLRPLQSVDAQTGVLETTDSEDPLVTYEQLQLHYRHVSVVEQQNADSIALIGDASGLLSIPYKNLAISSVIQATDLTPEELSIRRLVSAALTRDDSLSVFVRKWPTQKKALRKLLRWFPHAPIGPDLRSFIPRWINQKTVPYTSWREVNCVCPHGCANGNAREIVTFQHFFFTCVLAVAVKKEVCAIASRWCDIQPTKLETLWERCYTQVRLLPKLKYWNIALWNARRAMFNVAIAAICKAAEEKTPLIPPTQADAIRKWKELMSKFVRSLSQTKQADEWTCDGLWMLRVNQRHRVTLTF